MREFLPFFKTRMAEWWARERPIYLGTSTFRIPAAIIIPLLISAAVTAGSIGLEYLIAKKTKVSPVDRGKQDDIRISLPGYGEPIVWARGQVRCAPVWFWHTPIVDRPVTTPGHSGGKGPPKPPTPATVDHQYFTSVAGVFREGPISNVTRIWFGTDLVWNTGPQLSSIRYEAESATLGGTAAITPASYASNGAGVTHLGTGSGDNGYVDFAITVPDDGDYDIAISYQLDTGTQSFEVLLDSVSQGSVSCEASGAGLIGIQTIGFEMTAGAHTIRLGNMSGHSPNLDCIDVVETVSFADGVLSDSRVFTDLTDPTILPPTDETKPWPIYNVRPLEIGEDGQPLAGTSTITANLAKWGSPQIRIYRGTLDQPADPALIADKGVDNAPAYRGLATIFIQDIQLPNGALPNVTIESDDGITAVDQIVTDIYALGGRASSDLELSALSGLEVAGVIRTNQKPLGDTIKDLQTLHQFDMVEFDGLVNAVLRNRTTIDFTIPFAKLRAHLDGSEMPAQDAVITDIDPILLPVEVDINYLDKGQDYHNGVQFDRALDSYRYDVQSFSLALVDNEHNIKKLCSTLLHKAEMESRSFTFEAGPEFFPVVPGCVGRVTLPNATHTVRIGDGKYGLPVGLCQFQAVRQAASIYSPTGFGSISGAETPIAGFPSNSKSIILDGPLFRPEDAGDGTDAVLYTGLCGIGGGAWPGGFLYQEMPLTSGVYELVTLQNIPSSIGVTDGTTLASVSDTTVWDTVSSLTINFYHDPQLSSSTTGLIEDNPNLNLLAIKNPSTGDVECVQFKNATPGTAASPYVAQYTVDTFLRGRFESQNNVGSHTSADEVMFIDSTIKPRRQRKEDIGQTLKFKAETSGQQLESVPVTEQILYGNSLRPLAVSNVEVVDDGYGDWLITFVGHPRNLEESETYTVEIWTGSGRVTSSEHKRDLPVVPNSGRACLLVSNSGFTVH
jgi:hypothetical protein